MLASRNGPGLEKRAMSPSAAPTIGPCAPSDAVQLMRVFEAATLIAAADAAGEITRNRKSVGTMSVKSLFSLAIHPCVSSAWPDVLERAINQVADTMGCPATAGVVAVAAWGSCVERNLTW